MKIEINLPEFNGFAYIGEYRKPLRHDCFLDHDHAMIVTDGDGHYEDDYVFIYIREPKPEPTLLERIEAAYEGKEAVMLEWRKYEIEARELLRMPWSSNGLYNHYEAQSMKGFYKYVYQETGDFSARNSPTLSITVKGATVFPIAVLFEK